jgi:predicted cobalt transporter CbtA
MHGRPVNHDPADPSTPSHPDRWRILVVLVLALLVTSIDHTIINVALPQMVGDLDATAAGLQWIVAAYTVIFAGLLLTAGATPSPPDSSPSPPAPPSAHWPQRPPR